MLEAADTLCDIFKKEMGEKNDLYADAVYLQAKALFLNASPQMAVHTDKIDKALTILDGVIAYYKTQNYEGKREVCLRYGMCRILHATINKNSMQEEEAAKGFLRAGEIIMDLEKTTSTELMVQNILKEIEDTKRRYFLRTGKELDTNEL